MSVYWRIIALALGWWAALMGVLQLTHLPGDWGHAICGPWGCGPRLQSLVACHAFWFVVVIPLVAIPARFWSTRGLLRLGWALLFLGACGLVGVGIWQAAHDRQADYLVQRYLFLLATLVEVPIVPITLAGAWCRTVGARRARLQSTSETVADDD
jgi:hypothetical protein